MKILFVAMPSVHFIRWIENLKETKHEFFWFDVLDRKELNTTLNITKITGWKKRKIEYIKGEYYLYKKFPKIYNSIHPLLEVTKEEAFEEIIKEIKPNLVHSFEMQNCSYPLLNTLQKYPNIKWMYSCWGSDLFYYKNLTAHNKKIKKVLKRINILHTDCLRDFNIAKKNGFSGLHTGVIPGGTGYDLEYIKKFKKPLAKRKIILVKGYEHTFGRAINVLKALKEIENVNQKYEINVFGCHQKTIDYIEKYHLPFKYFTRDELHHLEMLKLFGKSRIYIGNSISDGMPNTLLEAIVMGAFPIQSNPGGVTEEIIQDGINGLIIDNPEDIHQIKTIIENCIRLDEENKFTNAEKINNAIAKNRLDILDNKKKIIGLYTKN